MPLKYRSMYRKAIQLSYLCLKLQPGVVCHIYIQPLDPDGDGDIYILLSCLSCWHLPMPRLHLAALISRLWGLGTCGTRCNKVHNYQHIFHVVVYFSISLWDHPARCVVCCLLEKQINPLLWLIWQAAAAAPTVAVPKTAAKSKPASPPGVSASSEV